MKFPWTRRSEPEKPTPPRLGKNELRRAAGRFRTPLNAGADKVFVTPDIPPSMVKAIQASGGSKLAMDSSISEMNFWGNEALNSVFAEGVTFLGYAYLSELAQRPEYRVIVETLATEMTRKWIKFKSTNQDDDKSERIDELNAEFEKLNVREAVAKAVELDGYFGRGHIYLDTGYTDDPEELALTIGDGWDAISKLKVGKIRPLRALRTVEPVWCYPTNYDSNDPLKKSWYEPTEWFVQAKKVHTSRLVTIIAREVPDLLKPTYSFGGLPMTQMAKPYVDNWLQTRQSVNDIISAFSVFVLKTSLQEQLQADGDGLYNRVDLFNNLRSNRGLMVLDKDLEEFQNVSAPLGGLESLQAQAQEHMAAVSHIPIVKLLGIQPAGLNASSEGELRSFYDHIAAMQEFLLRRPIHRILGLVMLSLWDETDPGISFDFVPLYALDENQQATVNKTKADTDAVLIDTGIISPEEARQSLANDPSRGFGDIDPEALPEPPEPEGGMPGLEDMLGAAGEKDDEQIDEMESEEAENADD